ncbi:uncharacterized protein LOC120555297 [Tachysurus ichikawai]
MSEPTGDSFGTLVRALHQLIKAYHHLSNTKISEGNTQGPLSLKRVTKRLESIVKPANLNSATGAMLYGNARNWLHNSLQILEDHYTSMIRETVDRINILPLSEGNRAWAVALRWVRRNLKNIKPVSIQMAHAEFQKILKQDTISTPNPTPLSDPAPHPNPEHALGTQTPDQAPQPTTTILSHTALTDLEGFIKPNPTPLSDPAPHPNPEHAIGTQTPDQAPQATTTTLSHTALMDLEGFIKQIRQTTNLTPQDQGQLIAAATPPYKKQQTKKRVRTDRFERHPHSGDKYRNWDLKPQRPILILGDSNLLRLPRINNPAVQVDSYPGANLSHAHHLIKYKTPTSTDTQKVVLLSFAPTAGPELPKRLETEAQVTEYHRRPLRRRGYTRGFLRSIYIDWQKTPPHPPGQQREADGRVIIPLVVKFSRYNLHLGRILKNNFHNTFGDDQLFLGVRVLTAFTKNPNLKELLVHSKLHPPNQKGKRLPPNRLIARNPITGGGIQPTMEHRP